MHWRSEILPVGLGTALELCKILHGRSLQRARELKDRLGQKVKYPKPIALVAFMSLVAMRQKLLPFIKPASLATFQQAKNWRHGARLIWKTTQSVVKARTDELVTPFEKRNWSASVKEYNTRVIGIVDLRQMLGSSAQLET